VQTLFDLVQRVSETTHSRTHPRRIVISRPDTDIQQLSVGSFVSDHTVVNFKLKLRRRWRNFVAADFEADLAAPRLCADVHSGGSVMRRSMVDLYDSEITMLLDKHCPKVTVRQKNNLTQ